MYGWRHIFVFNFYLDITRRINVPVKLIYLNDGYDVEFLPEMPGNFFFYINIYFFLYK